MRIRGVGGVVRVGYQEAASLGDWTLTRTRTTPEQEYQAEAQIVSADAFWSQQRPMVLELVMGKRRWVWDGVQPDLDAQSLAAVLTGGPAIH